LILVFIVKHRADHEANVISFELLAVNRQSLLAPAESNYLQSFCLGQLSHDLPEELDSSGLLVETS